MLRTKGEQSFFYKPSSPLLSEEREGAKNAKGVLLAEHEIMED
jgi:hypothetical protein